MSQFNSSPSYHGPLTPRLDLLVPCGWDMEAEPESEIPGTNENTLPNDIMEAFLVDIQREAEAQTQPKPAPPSRFAPATVVCPTAKCSKQKSLPYPRERKRTQLGASAYGSNGERPKQQVKGASSLGHLHANNKPTAAILAVTVRAGGEKEGWSGLWSIRQTLSITLFAES